MAHGTHSFYPEGFILPPIWDDDDAMFSLMQPIKRPKHIDLDGYNKKVKFWTDLLINYAKTHHVAVVNIQSLQIAFSRYFIEEGIHMTPQCFPEVFTELLESGELASISNHPGLFQSILKAGYKYLVKAPLDWTFWLTFGDASNPEKMVSHATKVQSDQNFALTDLSEQLASQFMTFFEDTYHSRRLTLRLPVYELNDFEAALTGYFPHDATREYIRKLCTDVFRCVRFESVSDHEGNWKSQVVRISTGVGDPLPSLSQTADSQAELSVLGGLAHLRSVIRQQEAEEQKLSTEIEARRNRIKALMKQNRLREAKSLLVRTKVLEKSLAQRQTHLHHLESMQIQIDSASDNQTVLRALTLSGRALKQTTGGSEGLAKVEDTMNDLSDTVHETNEISDLLSSFGQTSLVTDEDELENELKDILTSESKPDALKSVPEPTDKMSDEQLEAELAALDLDSLNFPDVPSVPIRDPNEAQSQSLAQ